MAYDVHCYYLDLWIDDSTTFIAGFTEVYASLLADSHEMSLSLGSNLNVDSVLIDGQAHDFLHLDEKLEVGFGFMKDSGQYVNCRVYYSGFGKSEKYWGGVMNSRSYGNGVTWTLSEPYSAKAWFPCNENLNDKSDSAIIHLTIPKGLKAGAPGLLQQVVDVGEEHQRYEWKTNYPIAYYLISLAVSQYHEYTIDFNWEGQVMPIINYIYDSPQYATAVIPEIDKTVDMLASFSELFGEYPFLNEKYGHCTAPMGGAMEHQTMTTTTNFNFELVAHELGHQWFGNQVTCSSWQHIWINEGFASYSEYLALEHLVGLDPANKWLQDAMDAALSYQRGSVFVPESSLSSEGRIFNYGLSYKKGAVLIHMIRQIMADDGLFYESLRVFQERHKHGTASADDYKLILEELTGKDFDYFFDQWYYGEGYPILQVYWKQIEDTVKIWCFQKGSANDDDLFQLDLEYLVKSRGGDTLVTHKIEHKSDTLFIVLEDMVTSIEPDPMNKILKSIGSISNVVDIQNLKKGFVSYPSKAESAIFIKPPLQSQSYRFLIYGSCGTLFKKSEDKFGKQEVDIVDLPPGVYYLYIVIDQESQVLKFIKV